MFFGIFTLICVFSVGDQELRRSAPVLFDSKAKGRHLATPHLDPISRCKFSIWSGNNRRIISFIFSASYLSYMKEAERQNWTTDLSQVRGA